MGSTLIFYINESVHGNLQRWAGKFCENCDEDHRYHNSGFIEFLTISLDE